MRTILVIRETQADANQLFNLLSNPKTYLHLPGVKRAELLRPGHDSHWGAGAIRQIWIGMFRFEEEILRSEPGRRIDYRVIRSRPPLDHKIGTILFTPNALQGCTVEWSSTYRVPIPIIGPLLEVFGGQRMTKAFDDAIRIAADLALSERT